MMVTSGLGFGGKVLSNQPTQTPPNPKHTSTSFYFSFSLSFSTHKQKQTKKHFTLKRAREQHLNVDFKDTSGKLCRKRMKQGRNSESNSLKLSTANSFWVKKCWEEVGD
jgi:hypothetical protein